MNLADGGAGNAPDLCCELPAAPRFIAGGGYGPDTAQADALAASVHRGLFAGAVTQGRPVGESADVRSPQMFVNHPSLEQLLANTAVGDDTAAEALPGRVFPGAWDGEPGWASPGVDY